MARLTCALMVLLSLLFGTAVRGAGQGASVRLIAPGNGEVRALVVGIDKYEHVTPLRGATADARDLDEALRSMGSPDVTTLIDKDATRTRVLLELERLVERVRTGDLVIITLAGHGSKEPEHVKGSSDNGSDEVFLLVGFDPSTGAGGTDKVLNHEFHHYIKLLEEHGAQVIFVADTCYGGGLAREIAAGSPDETYRELHYRLVVDDLKPVSTTSEAFLNALDFERTTFLAAVDSETKAPEVVIDGAYRGALSYAIARAIRGYADEKHDGKITLRELFEYTRRVVYQFSNERQSIVAVESPKNDLDRDIVLQLGSRGLPGGPATIPVALPDARPASAPPRPVRIASSSTRAGVFSDLHPLLVPFEVVSVDAAPDVTWDPVEREALAGGDKIALDVGIEDLPGVIDRTAAVRDIKDLLANAPQAISVLPNAKLNLQGSRIAVEVGDTTGRSLILVDITGVGLVQMLYPGAKTSLLASGPYRLPFVVRDPYGDDAVLAITSNQTMDGLFDALQTLDNRRAAGRLVEVIKRLAPPDARFGLVGLFTTPRK